MDDLFRSKVDFPLPGGSGEAVLEPTWLRFGAENITGIIFIDLGSFSGRFGKDFDCLSMDFQGKPHNVLGYVSESISRTYHSGNKVSRTMF